MCFNVLIENFIGSSLMDLSALFFDFQLYFLQQFAGIYYRHCLLRFWVALEMLGKLRENLEKVGNSCLD